MDEREFRRHDVLAIACLFLLITVIFPDVIFSRYSFFDRDSYRFYYPTKRIIHEIVRQGEFPWWNPYYSAGQPLAANPEYEIFYPIGWLIFLRDFHLGYNLHVIAHLYLAAAGMFLFLRSRRLRMAASLWGAVVFTFGGWMLSSTSSLLPYLFGAAWLPLILLFATRFVGSGRWIHFSLAAILLGVQATTGEPTTLLQSWILVVAFCCWPPGESRPALRLASRRLVAGSSIVLAGVAVGAIQIVPGFDLVRDTVRSDAFSFERVSAWSMHPLRPLEWIYPHLFGIASAAKLSFWGARLYPQMGYPFMLNIYFGVSALALAVGGLVARVRGWAWLALLCLGSYVLAIGAHTPLLRVLYDSGLFASVRYVEKFIFIALVSLVILSSLAIEELGSGNRTVLIGAVGMIGATTLAALFAVVYTMTSQEYAADFLRLWRLPANEQTLGWVATNALAWQVSAVRGLVTLMALALCWKAPRRGAWVLVAALALDLTRLSGVVVPRVPESFFGPPPLASTLTGDPSGYRLFHPAAWHSGSDVGRRYFEAPGARYWVPRNGMFPRTPAIWGFRSVLEQDYDQTNLRSTRDLVGAMWTVRANRQQRWAEMFMAMSNARYRALYRPPYEGLDGRTPEDVQPIVFVEEPEEHHRYYFADRAVKIRDRDELVLELTKGNWTPRTAYVSSGVTVRGQGKVLRTVEKSSTIDLDVESGDASLLVVSITNDRHWKARVDGHPVPIIPVNLTYMGLELPKGRHAITITYWNPWIPAAALGTLMSVLALMIIARAPRTLWLDSGVAKQPPN